MNYIENFVPGRNILLAGLLLFMLGVLGVVYFHTIQTLFQEWLKFDESLGHGLLVIATVAWLLYARVNWAAQPLRPVLAAGVPLAILSILWALAYSVGIEIIQQLILPIIILCSVLLLAGARLAKELIIPVALLYFAIPVWDYLNDVLLLITTYVVQSLIRISDVTAYIEGNSIFLPFGEIVIAEGCSGLRYFIIGLFLAVLSGYLYFDSIVTRALLVMAAIVLALLANWLRVYLITLIAYHSEMKSSLVNDHEFLGWIIFLVFMFPVFYFNYRYQDLSRDPGTQAKTKQENTGGSKMLLATLVFVFAVLAGPATLRAHVVIADESGNGKAYPSIAGVRPDSARMLSDDMQLGWTGQSLSAYREWRKAYLYQGVRIDHELYTFTRSGRYGELLPYIPTVYDRSVWAVESGKPVTVVLDDEKYELASIVLVNKVTRRRVVALYGYDVGGYDTSSYSYAKLYQIPAGLLGSEKAYLVTLAAACDTTCEREGKVLIEFLQSG